MEKVELTKEQWASVLELMETGANAVIQGLSNRPGGLKRIQQISAVADSLCSQIREQTEVNSQVNDMAS